MFKWISGVRIGVALLGLLSQAVLAQTLTATTQTKHCFWRVEGKSNTVYLLGSIHLLSKKFYPLDKPLEEAFAKSHKLVLEVDLKEMERPETQLKMLKMGRYADGDSLKNHVSKETYEKLDARMKQTGGSAALFDSFKPWMVAVALVGVELQKLGFNPEEGVDQYFYRQAAEASKKMEGLETADFQLSLFNDLTKEEEESMLKETFDEMDNLKKEFETMAQAWKAGDTKKLEETMVEEMRGYPDIYKKLLVERNTRWAKQMDKLSTHGKDVFVVVGAAHLVGKDSLVKMLQDKGYKVTQEWRRFREKGCPALLLLPYRPLRVCSVVAPSRPTFLAKTED